MAEIFLDDLEYDQGILSETMAIWYDLRTGLKGYEIIVSRNKKGTKKVKTVKAKGKKKVIKKLKPGKYYVKVRAWKSYKGNTVYGKYSKAKRVKVK